MNVSIRRALLGVGVAVLLWCAIAGVQTLRAAGDLRAAEDLLEAASDALAEGDLPGATDPLSTAAQRFSRAQRRFSGPAVLPLRLVPVAADNLRALRHLAASGAAGAEAGDELLSAIADLPGGVEALVPSGGGLPVDAYVGLVAPVRHADALLARSVRELDAARGIPVMARVAAARNQAEQTLPALAAAVHRAASILPVLDEFLGADGAKRYLFVAQNPAESRGTGGFIGAYSVLTLEDGRFSFQDFDEIQALPAYPPGAVVPPSAEFAARYNQYGGAGFWHNINMTPDFPTAARAMENLYAKGTGEQLDGVIAVDPFALEALLEIAGPVDVPGFGTVGADDVVEVISNRAHDEIADSEERKRLLGAVALHAFEGFLRGGGSQDGAARAAQTLIEVLREGHLLLRSADPDVQAALLQARVAGALRDAEGDFVSVVTNAGSAAKLDFYLERAIEYDVRLQEDGSLTGNVAATFVNDAPSSGVSSRVIGPNARGLDAGEQRLIVSVFGPQGATAEAFSRTRGSRPVLVGEELGRAAFDTVMEIPAGQSQVLQLVWNQSAGWSTGPQGRYQLIVQGQPTLRPTALTVRIHLPEGMVAAGVPDHATADDPGVIVFEGTLDGVFELDLDLVAEGGTGWWSRLKRWWSEPL